MRNLDAITERVQLVRTSDSALPLMLRWIIFSGIFLRPFVIDTPNGEQWFTTLIIFLIYASVVTLIAVKERAVAQNPGWIVFQILADTLFISVFYGLTEVASSDFFLFYALPLLLAGECLRARYVSAMFIIISMAFGVTLFILSGYRLPLNFDSFFRYFLPRWIYFLFVLYVLFFRRSLFKQQAGELEAVRMTAISIAKGEELEHRLAAILDAAIEILKARGCGIYLIRPDDQVPEVVAVKGVQSDFFKPGFCLDFGEGMVGEVIRTGEPIFINDYRNSKYKVKALENLFEAVIAHPLAFGGEVIGVIAVYDSGSRKFSAKHFPPLERLSQHAAVAIRDILMVENNKRQTAVLRILNQAGKEMTDRLDITPTSEAIARNVLKLAECFNKTPPLYACVALLSEDKRSLKVAACFPETHRAKLQERVQQIDLQSESRGIIGNAINEGESELVRNVKEKPYYIEVLPEANTELAVPIRGRNEVIGVLNIEHEFLNAYPDDLRYHVEGMAAQAGTALENDSLFQENEKGRIAEEKQRRAEEALRKASLKISLVRGVNEVAQSILDNLNLIIPHDRSTLQLLPEGNRRSLLARRNLADSEINLHLLRPIEEDPLIKRIIDTREIYPIPSTENNDDWQQLPETEKVKSWIGVPLTYSDKVIGIITIDHFEHYVLRERQANLLRLFSNHAASVLQNAMLIRQNEDQIQELSDTRDKLETYIEHTGDYLTLANIGLVFGESIHFAGNELGMAKTKASNILLHYYKDEEELKASAQTIINNINSYLEVLTAIQQKVIVPPSTQIDLHSTLDRAVDSKRISDRIKITRNYLAKNSRIWALKNQLRQVFLVVLQNAITAMNGEGELSLETRDVTKDESEFLEVMITDTGPGIPKVAQQDLFKMKPFTGGRKGMKLGLPWAYSFLRIYGGDLAFKTSNKGTTVSMRFPIDWRDARKI